MKDQYFGDFGDYQKVSLLEHLQKQKLKVVVHWMKTRDDDSTDGKHITYLTKPERWRTYSPEVFDYLKAKVESQGRNLRHIENSPFCAECEFISEYIENTGDRKKALRRAIARDRDIILFDPDNGIEVASTNPKSVHKYVTWAEVAHAFDSNKSVIIYQHFARVNRETFIQRKVEEICDRFFCDVASLQVKHSVYFFMIQPHHKGQIYESISEFSERWRDLSLIRHHKKNSDTTQ